MTGMNNQLDGVTVQALLADLHEAVAHLDLQFWLLLLPQ